MLVEGAKILASSGGEQIGMLLLVVPSRSALMSFISSGTVTSGIPSPSLGKNIAMAYVKSGWHKKGTAVEVDVRNKLRKAVLTPMPFVPTRYYRGS